MRIVWSWDNQLYYIAEVEAAYVIRQSDALSADEIPESLHDYPHLLVRDGQGDDSDDMQPIPLALIGPILRTEE